jgi:bisanhydrobacterioruberin hydratase
MILSRTVSFIYLVFVCGVIGIAIEATRPVIVLTVPYVLLLSAVLMLINTIKSVDIKARRFFVFWCLSIFILTILLEFLGVNYALVFGSYRYHDVLGVKVGGVPLIIGVNWVTTILGSVSFLRKYSSQKIYIVIGAGVLATAFDLLLESVALYLNFWEWAGPIPWQNYAAWFFIAAVFTLIFERAKISLDGSFARALLAAQVIFFFGIKIVMCFA